MAKSKRRTKNGSLRQAHRQAPAAFFRHATPKKIGIAPVFSKAESCLSPAEHPTSAAPCSCGLRHLIRLHTAPACQAETACDCKVSALDATISRKKIRPPA